MMDEIDKTRCPLCNKKLTKRKRGYDDKIRYECSSCKDEPKEKDFEIYKEILFLFDVFAGHYQDFDPIPHQVDGPIQDILKKKMVRQLRLRSKRKERYHNRILWKKEVYRGNDGMKVIFYGFRFDMLVSVNGMLVGAFKDRIRDYTRLFNRILLVLRGLDNLFENIKQWSDSITELLVNNHSVAERVIIESVICNSFNMSGFERTYADFDLDGNIPASYRNAVRQTA